ncbi:unnamed protein product [Phytophthora fragariaefolia]|uniref:Unnamed protein product n=1 Tax=Phytophthora fragariaefolia TaxID=1490495 RepID=A0A9W7CWF9_9STRA|nr:unnamed protein product [Phytophthora fragariaefolia]
MFRLFHGSIDSNLRLLPAAPEKQCPGGETEDNNVPPLEIRKHKDGMDLLMDIAAARKRLRKLRLALEARSHNQSLGADGEDNNEGDSVMKQQQVEKMAVEAELEMLLSRSPAARLQKKCAEFFPTLLQALDVRGTSAFSELQGLGYFPMDQPTFLALQTFVNGLQTELKLSNVDIKSDSVAGSALFFKGNLLWGSMDTVTMHLLYKFLRLREERGMTTIRDDEIQEVAEPYPDTTPDDDVNSQLWMANAYDDTFLPVWSSKLSYAECDAVFQSHDGPPHLRRAAGSLHKQHPVSLSTFLSDAPPSSSGGALPTSSTIAAESSPFGSPSHSPAASTRFAPPVNPGSSKSAIKARERSIAFRNAGLLLKNGCFSKLQLANRARMPEGGLSETEAVWSPFIFAPESTGSSVLSAVHRAAVWHEADLTMIIVFRTEAANLDATDAASKGLHAALASLENYLDGQQRFQRLAELISSRYNATFAPEKNAPNIHPLPPFLYINRINLAFRMQQVPRLLKCKGEDLFPVPVKLLAHYLPASTMAIVNELHAELHRGSGTGNREICVRTRHAGWVLAKKSETSHRELYVFFDSKISSVYDLSGASVLCVCALRYKVRSWDLTCCPIHRPRFAADAAPQPVRQRLVLGSRPPTSK